MIRKLKKYFNNIYRRKFINTHDLKNFDFTLVCNNCLGGFMNKDFNLRFNSPFINLFIRDEDYVELLNKDNFKLFLNEPIVEVKDKSVPYPVGKIGNIRLDFMHYKSIEEAITKFEQRRSRMNFDNLFFIMTCVHQIDDKLINRFEEAHFKNKVIFVNKPNDKYKSAFYIKGFENQNGLGFLWEYQKPGKRYYDQFDFVKFFNQEGE